MLLGPCATLRESRLPEGKISSHGKLCCRGRFLLQAVLHLCPFLPAQGEEAARPIPPMRVAQLLGEEDRGRGSGLWSQPFLRACGRALPSASGFLSGAQMPSAPSPWHRNPAGGCLTSDVCCTVCVSPAALPCCQGSPVTQSLHCPLAATLCLHLMAGNPGASVLLTPRLAGMGGEGTRWALGTVL